MRTILRWKLCAVLAVAVSSGLAAAGAIRGFAVTLSLGLLSNLFTSTFVSRTLFELTPGQAARTRVASTST